MRALAVFAIVWSPLQLCIVTPSQAGVSGESETRFQIDNDRYGETETSVEQWTSLYYKDNRGDLRMAVQFAVEAGESNTSEQLYQCFLRSGDSDGQPELTLGRFALAYTGGFDTLDGFSIRRRLAPITWRVYSGKPHKLDGYVDEDADLLLGFDTLYDLSRSSTIDGFQKLALHLGLENTWRNSTELVLHGGISGERPDSDDSSALRDFQLALDYDLKGPSLRRAVFDTRFDLKHQGQVRLGYRFYQPDGDPETFRDRYHGIYNDERQSVTRGVWYLPSRGSLETRLEVSGNRHEQGNGGLGMAAEFIYTTAYGPVFEVRSDYLEIDDDRVVSNYFRHRQPVTSMSLFQAEAVYQAKRTRLSGTNHLSGMALTFSRRLHKQLFMNLSGEWLDHSDRDDEYRLGISLRYDFFQTNTGELP